MGIRWIPVIRTGVGMGIILYPRWVWVLVGVFRHRRCEYGVREPDGYTPVVISSCTQCARCFLSSPRL